MDLTFKRFREENRSRQLRWPGADQFQMTDYSNELAGEVGEVCNIVKKLRRAELGVLGNQESGGELHQMLIDEIGDVLTCLDLLAIRFNIELDQALIAKFNKVSERHNFSERLP